MIHPDDRTDHVYALFQKASKSILGRKGATATGYLQKALRLLEAEGPGLDQNFYLTMLFAWADLFWSVNRPDLALEVFDLFESQSPGDPQISLHRAIALFHLARFDEAYQLLSDLEDRGYPAADLHFFLGCLAERVSREATAMAHFERAAMLEPERYSVPLPTDEKSIRAVMKKVMGTVAAPLRASFKRARVIVEPLPSDEVLQESEPRVDPLALTMIDLDEATMSADLPEILNIHLYRKNIEKVVVSPDELEERLSESIAHELSALLQGDEEIIRSLIAPVSEN